MKSQEVRTFYQWDIKETASHIAYISKTSKDIPTRDLAYAVDKLHELEDYLYKREKLVQELDAMESRQEESNYGQW